MMSTLPWLIERSGSRRRRCRPPGAKPFGVSTTCTIVASPSRSGIDLGDPLQVAGIAERDESVVPPLSSRGGRSRR